MSLYHSYLKNGNNDKVVSILQFINKKHHSGLIVGSIETDYTDVLQNAINLLKNKEINTLLIEGVLHVSSTIDMIGVDLNINFVNGSKIIQDTNNIPVINIGGNNNNYNNLNLDYKNRQVSTNSSGNAIQVFKLYGSKLVNTKINNCAYGVKQSSSTYGGYNYGFYHDSTRLWRTDFGDITITNCSIGGIYLRPNNGPNYNTSFGTIRIRKHSYNESNQKLNYVYYSEFISIENLICEYADCSSIIYVGHYSTSVTINNVYLTDIYPIGNNFSILYNAGCRLNVKYVSCRDLVIYGSRITDPVATIVRGATNSIGYTTINALDVYNTPLYNGGSLRLVNTDMYYASRFTINSIGYKSNLDIVYSLSNNHQFMPMIHNRQDHLYRYAKHASGNNNEYNQLFVLFIDHSSSYSTVEINISALLTNHNTYFSAIVQNMQTDNSREILEIRNIKSNDSYSPRFQFVWDDRLHKLRILNWGTFDGTDTYYSNTKYLLKLESMGDTYDSTPTISGNQGCIGGAVYYPPISNAADIEIDSSAYVIYRNNNDIRLFFAN